MKILRHSEFLEFYEDYDSLEVCIQSDTLFFFPDMERVDTGAYDTFLKYYLTELLEMLAIVRLYLQDQINSNFHLSDLKSHLNKTPYCSINACNEPKIYASLAYYISISRVAQGTIQDLLIYHDALHSAELHLKKKITNEKV